MMNAEQKKTFLEMCAKMCIKSYNAHAWSVQNAVGEFVRRKKNMSLGHCGKAGERARAVIIHLHHHRRTHQSAIDSIDAAASSIYNCVYMYN